MLPTWRCRAPICSISGAFSPTRGTFGLDQNSNVEGVWGSIQGSPQESETGPTHVDRMHDGARKIGGPRLESSGLRATAVLVRVLGRIFVGNLTGLFPSPY